jgi:hypothetical protein
MGDHAVASFAVPLPAGGEMYLQSAEEVDLWNKSTERYIDDFHLTKTNDLMLLGVILQQQLTIFRAQRKLNGLVPETDERGDPTGRYIQEDLKPEHAAAAMKALNTASDQIRSLEKSLGIDKVTREAGGAVSVSQYLRTLKSAAHERGIHISKRIIAYEAFVNELRTRLRMLKNLDAEDRAYHSITPEHILDWASDELAALEEVDKRFARERGKLYVGKL